MKDDKIFYTRDIYLASTLITLKFFMTNVDYQIEGDKKKPIGYFGFEETPDLKRAISEYRQGQLAVEPRAFITNMRALQSEINNEYKSPHSKFAEIEGENNI